MVSLPVLATTFQAAHAHAGQIPCDEHLLQESQVPKAVGNVIWVHPVVFAELLWGASIVLARFANALCSTIQRKTVSLATNVSRRNSCSLRRNSCCGVSCGTLPLLFPFCIGLCLCLWACRVPLRLSLCTGYRLWLGRNLAFCSTLPLCPPSMAPTHPSSRIVPCLPATFLNFAHSACGSFSVCAF